MDSEHTQEPGDWSAVAIEPDWQPGSRTELIRLESGSTADSSIKRSFIADLQPFEEALPSRQLLASMPASEPAFLRMALVMLASDITAITLSCTLAGLLVSRIFKLSVYDLTTVSFSLMIPILLGNLLASLYPGIALNPVVEFRQLSRSVAVSFFGILSLICLGRYGIPWIAFLTIAAPLQFMLAPLCRAWVRTASCRRKWWGYPVMIFGAGDATATVVLNLLQHPGYGLRPTIILDPEATVQSAMGLAVVNRPRLTSALAKQMKIRHAIVVLPDLSREYVTKVLERHAKGIRHVMLTSAISPFSPGLPILWRDTRDLAGVAGVEVRNRLLDPIPKTIKRTMDLVLTITGGLCILPLIGVLAMLVKLTSKGPIFFSHTRIGHRGKRFKAWKFRSMVVNGEDILRDHFAANEDARLEWELDHKLKNDPRVTRIGKFLRKTSLDELPQLWNVFKGEMSLVGPRPIVDAEIIKYGKCYNIYKAVHPGITGLWQVSGRNNTTYEERLHFDRFYVRNWSPWLDMHILARTVATLACGHGAY
jgi:Undecaprenyl-phosphate galactose phosphotransferase WbaP